MKRTLTTVRFSLTPVAPADAPRIAELCDDRDIAENSARIPHPYTLEDAKRFIDYAEKAFASGGEYVFGVRENGALIACAGVLCGGDSFDLGYWVGAAYRGRGVATEAARRVVRFAFEGLGAKRITAGHFINNPASGKVLSNIGFKPTGETEMIFCQARGRKVETACFALCSEDMRG
ncbi:MAG: GNAT family N-acetyltransferase [Parvularculaceae bacterium]